MTARSSLRETSPSQGALLVNLGTPRSAAIADVRAYLGEFLSDPRVLDLPAPLRRALLHGVILRVRPRRSAEAYAKIWTAAGSPLLLGTERLRGTVQKRLGERYRVELAMRYGEPSLRSAIAGLREAGVDDLHVVPLFPQYAAATVGSVLDRVYAEARRAWDVPRLRVIEPFFSDPGFLDAQAELARPLLAESGAEHVLFSHHGLPERQLRRSDPTGERCLASPDCCERAAAAGSRCYRAQCFATARALARTLGLEPGSWSVGFQSRFGRTRWCEPHTEAVLESLAGCGVRRVVVLCPSFVVDCLETLEEIGIRARERWRALGGESLGLVPCVGTSERFADAVAGWIRGGAPGAP